MSLTSLGEILKREREKRHLSVEDVASHLKMNPRLIRDIEAGDESILPPVYVRGFMRAYSKFMNMHSEEFDEALGRYGQEEQELLEHEIPDESYNRGVKQIKKVAFGCALVLIILALVFGGFSPSATMTSIKELVSSFMDATPNTPSTMLSSDATKPVEAPKMPAGTGREASSGVASPSGKDDAPTSSSSTAADTETSATEAAPVRTEGFAPSGEALPATGSGQGVAANAGLAPQTAAAPKTNQLVLTGLNECWVHATADATDMREFSIMPGETFSLSFRERLVLKLGNAGGVRLMYNGKDLSVAGTDGQVKTMTFPQDAQN